MPDTPFFPQWHRRLSALTGRVTEVRAATLCELERCFAACLTTTLFPKACEKQNSRDRLYTRWRTVWCVLWQSLQPHASGREVVRQLQALFCLQAGPRLSENDGAYCRARARLPLDQFAKALSASARATDQCASQASALQARPVKVVDGSTVILPDTPKNRAAYPPLHSPPPNFPQMRIVVLFSLCSGAVLALAGGNLHQSELALFSLLLNTLVKGDIVIGDRGFGGFVVVALLQGMGVDFVGRTTRRTDGRRRIQRLGKDDGLMRWEKLARPSPWLALAGWAGLPPTLTVRVLRGRVVRRGFRVRQVTVITTLLDPKLYPADEVLRAYLQRWRLEMCLDDLKTTLGMDLLRSRSPAMARQEVYARLIGHNFVRWTMAQAARSHDVELERISFKGTLDAVRQFAQALSRARSQRNRAQLWAELLRTLAADHVPQRPGRREPRAVKRRKNKYPRLSVPRHRFRDRLKSHARRALARRRSRALK